MNYKTQNSLSPKACGGPAVSALLLATVLTLNPFASVRAQFTTSAGNEPTFSIGVFQLTVDPAFAFLFAPHAPAIYYYPGYSPGSGVLTSPTMYDFTDTSIGVSINHVRSATPGYFPVFVGTGAETDFPDPVPSYASYPVIPPGFVFPAEPYGKDEIMTEIESFNLETFVDSRSGGLQCSNSDPRVPPMFTNVSVVVAGNDIPNLAPTQRSIGMVQEVGASDFPAQSFFDIFVEVTLPISVGNNSAYDFPPFSGTAVPVGYQPGAVLYNDASDPLVITNLGVTSLPPSAIYVHGVTTAVPMKFKFANPPYWAANDIIGYLVLAGHGVISNSATSNCAALATATTTLLDQTLGPIGTPNPQMPVPWLRADDSFPSTNSSYVSVSNTVTSGSGTTVLDDTVSFVVSGTTTIYIRDLVLTGLSNSIAPPPANTARLATDTSTALNYQFSTDGVTFSPVSSTTPGAFQLSISNNGTTGSTTNFSLRVNVFSNTASTFAGTVFLRVNPAILSQGVHTIAPDPRGYRISSYFDANLQLSFDDATWYSANKTMRLQAGMPPAAPGSIFVTTPAANQVVLNWQGGFTLQSATSVAGPYTSVPGPVTNGPYTNLTFGLPTRFYRLTSQ